ncbi:MAG: hypothetical protein JWN68_1539 [Nocardioides sp.]|jgi:hypothetical protein|nr:hypothetical protein [Cryobacterium sp.]MCW2833586.1 hypothetical protein [Nocardioides sp.]
MVSDEDLVVDRWKRYGKDRLYVTLPEQDADATGASRLVVAAPSTKAVPESTPTGSPVSKTSAPVATAPAPVDPFPAEAPVARPWLDLATNQRGAEAREQAQAVRDAAPVRTVLARVLGVHTDERAWRIGADGELAKVAKRDPR